MEDLPSAVRAFLDEHIFSASQLEVLLRLREAAGEEVTLADLARSTALPRKARVGRRDSPVVSASPGTSSSTAAFPVLGRRWPRLRR